MTDNKTLILNQFEENKGQFVIIGNDVVRLVAIAEDDMDYYYVVYDGRKVIWHSCVGSYTVLKNKIEDRSYSELIRIAKINHYDQDDFLMPETDQDKAQQKHYAKRHKQKMEKEEGENKYLTPFCWDFN
jgi:hypothetical protein